MKLNFLWAATAAAFTSLTMLASAAAAADARIIKISGKVEPDIGASKELSAGERVKLGPKAIVVVIHYKACEEIEVRGGQVSILPTRVQVRGGEILSRNKGDCPGQLTLTDTDAQGAVVLMRGDGDEQAKVDAATSAGGPRPRFLIEGEKYAVLHLYENGERVASLPIRRRRADWPDERPPLSSGAVYDFALEASDGAHVGGKLAVTEDGPGLIILSP